MHGKRILSALAGAGVVGAVLLATASAGTANAAPHGIVHLASFTDNDGAGASVVVSGAVGDFGEAVSVNPDGSISADHGGQQKFVLTQGTFKIDFSALDHKLVAAFPTHPVDKHSCSGHITVNGSASVVQGSGTGAYQGIAGTLQLALTLDELVPQTQCDWTGSMLKQSIMILGSGELSLAN
jgi:hypothetical protein